jgi:hypothetical protein
MLRRNPRRSSGQQEPEHALRARVDREHELGLMLTFRLAHGLLTEFEGPEARDRGEPAIRLQLGDRHGPLGASAPVDAHEVGGGTGSDRSGRGRRQLDERRVPPGVVLEVVDRHEPEHVRGWSRDDLFRSQAHCPPLPPVGPTVRLLTRGESGFGHNRRAACCTTVQHANLALDLRGDHQPDEPAQGGLAWLPATVTRSRSAVRSKALGRLRPLPHLRQHVRSRPAGHPLHLLGRVPLLHQPDGVVERPPRLWGAHAPHLHGSGATTGSRGTRHASMIADPPARPDPAAAAPWQGGGSGRPAVTPLSLARPAPGLARCLARRPAPPSRRSPTRAPPRRRPGASRPVRC